MLQFAVMRYAFILLSISVAWVVGIIIASFALETSERLLLYLALMIFTVGMYIIGFTSRKT